MGLPEFGLVLASGLRAGGGEVLSATLSRKDLRKEDCENIVGMEEEEAGLEVSDGFGDGSRLVEWVGREEGVWR